ncbi:RHS repeat-associated core domain-containing protein [Vibrio mediterranei]|uniref:RHS repeat-associated core domain-containing protein n=1 Tax=Vibrio mediterranei TaxID=689 RepID=UPI002283EA70|nr:RHS repeat-associated core domain-containing protein [Vibrio mediterranei]MCY9855996.1 cysteine peptidase family C39 domain-containing protein [Vibrio mediterranei]
MNNKLWVAALIGISLSACHHQEVTLENVQPALTKMDLSHAPSHEALIAAGQLGGPLSPTAPVDADDRRGSSLLDALSHDDSAERWAFGKAIQDWNEHHYQQAARAFDAFRHQYPQSPWASEATLHMGCEARFTGQYSKANALFLEVIKANQHRDYQGAKMMTAKAKSRLAVLRVMENNPEEAQRLFADVYRNAPDWRLKTYASTWIRKLSALKNEAGSLLDCGTRALSYILSHDNQLDAAEVVLGFVPRGHDGFSLSDLMTLSSQYGYQTSARKLTIDELSTIPTPAILQVDRSQTGGKGHYWILDAIEGGHFNIYDPQMKRRFHYTPAQLTREWQGNALVFYRGKDGLPGQAMGEKEASQTYGGCCGIQRPEDGLGEPPHEPSCPQGAPIWVVNPISFNLFVKDIPMWYRSSIGPDVTVSLSYNSQSLLARNEPFGAKWMFNYSSYIVIDPGGAATLFASDGAQHVFIKDRQGVYQSDTLPGLSLTRNAQGQLQLEQADGATRIYGVPPHTNALQNFLLKQVDRYGQALSFHYNDHALLTRIEDAQGRITTLNYAPNGLVSSVSDPFGRQAHFDYDSHRNLVAITDMQGYTSRIGYDGLHFISYIEDAKGRTRFKIEPADGVNNGFNAYPSPNTPMWENYRITITDPQGAKEEYYFNGYTGKGWYVDKDHYDDEASGANPRSSTVAKTQFSYVTPNGKKGEIARIDFPDGRVVSQTYYKNNKVKSITTEDGTASYVWNDKGYLTQFTDPLGNTTMYTYADNGVDVLKVSSPLGVVSMTYNAHHQITRYQDIEGHITDFQYDALGNLLRRTDAKGVQTHFIRDAQGQTQAIKINDHTLARYLYDEIGRVASVQGLNHYTTHYQYNQINTLLKVTGPSGRSIEQRFGTCPRLMSSETLPGHRTYRYGYDKAKRLTTVTDPLNRLLTLTRSKSGHVTAITDSHQNKTHFAYTSSGQLKEKRYADGSAFHYDYSHGRLTRVTDARGVVKRYKYNGKGQLSQVSYSDDTADVRYTYDAFGRVSTVEDGLGDTRFGYYANGLLKFKDGPLTHDRIELTYTERNALSTITVDGTLNASYDYDDLGRLVHVEALGQSFRYQYDDDAAAAKVTTDYPNGITGITQYNRQAEVSERLYQKGAQALARYQYRFNDAGQLAEQTGTKSWVVPTHGFLAHYNALNQIMQWNGDSSLFAYDADGNMVKGLLQGHVPFTAEYDGESRLVRLDFIQNRVHYSERFRYGFDHQLANYQRYDNGALAEETQFIRLGLVELEARTGQSEQRYAWRPDRPGGIGGLLVTQSGGAVYTYLYNHQGSIQKVVDKTGAEVEHYLYTPYGVASGSHYEQQPFGYSTKRSDFKSGLVYFGDRFYVPSLRRWLTRDPSGELGGINLYGYVNGDPLGYIDPDGQNPLLISMGIGAVNGAVGAWVQGGDFDGILEGAVAGLFGGTLGAVNPVMGAMAGNAAGQLMALDRNGKPLSCFNWGSMLGAGFGTGLAAALTAYPGATFLGAQLDFGFSTIGGIVGGQ